ncbi:putative acetylserotonin methytransferase-like protein [Phaeoacremonium minimum UCRPA7]|uniref:Putative acetylserotonin methytransferase-like protein n=1 Tax=Phaeoacremonium minimum (strain UCR-PA7) TaxID=1286976 RepID=R8BGK2_PHAM7|nr:putative acetylserotonin methytransferase-like protein [Phaeoacremonium minimum UCRPA7]EON98352.1 putative acetylserotonin methytransferase-like protein [Phaeoacremonium minimum UCRPA7]
MVPPTSTTEELRGFWKVANGWKAPSSEGRVYCLKMTSEKDAPIYTLSSATQSFYSLRLDPTSASAYVTMSRHDPNKPFKGPANPAPSSSSASVSGKTDSSKGWQECLNTTLEEESRKHPPNDGLVALLYPQAAAKMALERPDDPTAVMTAERECARLVWDEDTSNHYVVHPALAMPFCVTVERNPAWSRTEYTLEHIESPQHVARLTRDGTGTGWLEVDTSIAAKIDAVYLVDVAVAALMLVAHGDHQFTNVEVFEPPPMVFGAPPGSVTSKHDKRSSKMSARSERKEKKAASKRSKSRMEEFELDLESQHSDLAKLDVKDKDMDKLPGVARIIIKTLSVTFKCFIWAATLLFKALTWMIAGAARCLTSDKL